MNGQQNKLGALWENQDRKGNAMMSGVIEVGGKKIKIVVFHNERKQESRHPDWYIFESTMKPRPDSGRSGYRKPEPPADDFPGPDDDPGPGEEEIPF